jgi:fibronectin-binding autotransporter adhesin
MSETCVVRPELIEFSKGNNEFLSIIAHPTLDSTPSGFRFTTTTFQTSTVSNIIEGSEISYVDNLANIYAKMITLDSASVSTIQDVTTLTFASDAQLDMNSGNISGIGELTTANITGNPIRIYDNIINMNDTGNITQVKDLSFSGATSSIDMAGGLVNNMATINMTPLGVLNMDGGLIDFGGSTGTLSLRGGAATIGDLDIEMNTITSFSGSVNVETVTFTDAAVTNVNKVTFDGATAEIEMAGGLIENVATIDMALGGASALNMDGGTLNFGGLAGTLTLAGGSATIGELTVSAGSITGSGSVNVETVTFTDAAVTNLNKVTFDSATAEIEMAGGLIENVATIDMALGGASALNMDGGTLNFGGLAGTLTLAGGSATIGELTVSAGSITGSGSVNVETVTFTDAAVTNVNKVTFDGATAEIEMAGGLIENVATIDMALGGASALNMDGGTLNFGGSTGVLTLTGGTATVGDLDITTDTITSSSGSVNVETVTFTDAAVTNVNKVTFDGATAEIEMAGGLIENVATIDMALGGASSLTMDGGLIDFGGSAGTLTLAGGSATIGELTVSAGSITGSGSVNVETVTFTDAAVTNVNKVTFDSATAEIEMAGGLIENVATIDMALGGASALNMDGGTLNFGGTTGTLTLAGGSATIGELTVSAGSITGSGSVNVETVTFTDAAVTNVNKVTFDGATAEIEMAGGLIENVATIDMALGGASSVNMDGGTLNFGGTTGTLTLAGGSATIGELTVSAGSITGSGSVNVETVTFTDAAVTNVNKVTFDGATAEIDMTGGDIINVERLRNSAGTVTVEQSVFNGKNIQTLQVSPLSGESETNVYDAKFEATKMTVTNVDTDIVTNTINTTNLTLTTRAPEGTISTNSRRITNVGTPVEDTDAVNKAYVANAVQFNQQGLKPKTAVDYAAFETTWTTEKFGGSSYFISHLADVDESTDPNSMRGEMVIRITGLTDGVISLDGLTISPSVLNVSDIADIAGGNVPKVPRKRILINGLNTASYDGLGASGTGAILSGDSVKISGMNGIWEVVRMEQMVVVGLNPPSEWTLILVRSEDMNQDHEVMNGSYTYVKNGSVDVKNYGFVVSNDDPITLKNGVTFDASSNLKEVKWVVFNNVNYELAFKTDGGDEYETLYNASQTTKFAKGGILMKYDAADEKSIMVNTEILNYDLLTAELNVNGNINFGSLTSGDSYIVTGAAQKIDVMSTKFEVNGVIRTTNVHVSDTLDMMSGQIIDVAGYAAKTDGTGIISMHGGSVNMDGGLIDFGGSTGTLTLAGGSATIGELTVSAGSITGSGSVNVETVTFTDAAVTNVNKVTFDGATAEIEMAGGLIENVATIDMATGGASSVNMDGGLIDFGGLTGTLTLAGGSATIGELTVSAGSITGSGSVNVETVTFTDALVTNVNKVTFDGATAEIEMAGGLIENVASVNMALGGASSVNMDGGTLNFGGSTGVLTLTGGTATVGDLDITTDTITSSSGSVNVETVTFTDAAVTNVNKVTFDGATAEIEMAGGLIENVATIDMALGGVSSVNMDGGTLNFGGSTGTLTLAGGSATIGELTVSVGSITGSGSVNVETVTFTDAAVTNVNKVTFDGATAEIEMAGGLIENVAALNMALGGASSLTMDGGLIDFGGSTGVLTLTGGTATVGDLDITTDTITSSSGSVNVETVTFTDAVVTNVNKVTFDGATAEIEMAGGLIENVATIDMAIGGASSLTMDGGLIDFGGLAGTLTLMGGTATVGDLDITTDTITSSSGSVNVETVTFTDAAVTNVNKVTFDDATAEIEMAGGLIENVATIDMAPGGASALNMDGGTLNFGGAAGTLTLTGGSATIGELTVSAGSITGSGSVNVETVTFTDALVTNVNKVTFDGASAEIEMAGGLIENVATIDMAVGGASALTMDGGLIDFGGAAGTLTLAGGSATIGELTVSAGSITGSGSVNVETVTFTDAAVTNVNKVTFDGASSVLDLTGGVVNNVSSLTNSAGTVTVEDSVFDGTTIRTQQVRPLSNQPDGETNVYDAKFEATKMTVTNVYTNVIQPKDSTNLTLNAPASGGTIDVSSKRVTNVSTPVEDNDAANKLFVLQALQQNVQGLRPKMACDYSAMAATWSTEKFGGNSYFMTHTPSVDSATNPVSMRGELCIYIEGLAIEDTLNFDTFEVSKTVLNTSDIADLAGGDTAKIARKRILINGLNTTSYTSGAVVPMSSPTNTLALASPDVVGLNGVWEVVRLGDASPTYGTLTIDGTVYYKLVLTRSEDMNQDNEVMNGAYVYVNAGTHSNMGYVVSNNDSIVLSSGITHDINATATEVTWVMFNNVNYELAFKTEQGTEYETLGTDTHRFGKGGILMKYDENDEKSIMVNTEILQYDVTTDVLNVRGNLDFGSLTTGDSYITTTSGNFVDVMSSRFKVNGLFETSDIVANTVTCESDINLKKDIEPMKNGISLVSSLKPVTYHWKDKWSNSSASAPVEYGFIAQDVEPLFPSLVRTNPDTGIKSVDYQKMVSILVLSVQELTAQVKELQERCPSPLDDLKDLSTHLFGN